MVDCGLNDTKNRFVCPNDRQLALRAKLKTGWSVKTASAAPPTPLDQDEQDTILEVIKRAEQLEQVEQERVGRLVERLENLRRNALGRNSSQCLLCGSAFGIIGAQKVVCIDCRKFVCQKCAIDGCSPKHHSPKEQWLCMICAETREIWKKSGAWFFKTLPKYVLPNQPGTSFRERNSRCSKYGRSARDDDSSSDEDRKPWPRVDRRNSSTESTHDFDCGRGDLQIPVYGKQQSISDSQLSVSKEYHPSTKDHQHYHQSSKDYYLGGKDYHQSSIGREYHPVLGKEYHPVLAKDFQPLGKEYHPLANYLPNPSYYESSRNCSTSSTSPYSDHKSWEETSNVEFSRAGSMSAESSEASRRESTTSKSASEWNWNEGRNDEKISPGACSIGSSVFKSNVEEAKPLDFSMGVIELTLTYDAITSTLLCHVIRAKNLIPMDINGLSDPFCKLNIWPNSKSSTRLRTKTVHKTRNPEFNENLTFYDLSESDLKQKFLHILVVDDDKYGHDYMGETRIPLAKLKEQWTMFHMVPLENLRREQKGPLPSPDLNQWFDDLWSRGQILIALQYNTKRRSLLVTIIQCANLLPMDNNGFSDPFVKLWLKPDTSIKKYKTHVKWKTLNPVFNEEFSFESRPNELAAQSLYMEVWDKDIGKSNDYLGGLILGGMGSKGRRLKQWLDMIKYPNHNHVCWHNLTEDTVVD